MAAKVTRKCGCGKDLGSYTDPDADYDYETHTYCDACYKELQRQLDDRKKRR